MDLVKVPKEGGFDCCEQYGMQVHPLCPCHQLSKECQIGVELQQQWEAAVTSALALRQQFMVRGDVLKRVKVFKYLGQMMAQDDSNNQALCAQLWKARTTLAWVSQVLRNKNTSLFVAAQFYQAVVQAILLYGSEMWVIS
jgi:hypothetical protein